MLNLPNLTIPQLSAVARRSALTALGLTVVVLGASLALSQPAFGGGFALGQALALVNFRLIGRATLRAAESDKANKRRLLATNTLARLGGITVVAVGLALVDRPLAFGVLIALALFQFVLLSNIVVSLVRNPMMGDVSVGSPSAEDDD